ncbi:MAG: alpha/beta fold hydrolase [Microthrixaceae bacterium]
MQDVPVPPPTRELPEPRDVTSADGTRLATYDLGGDGPDLLFVHATGFCAGVWTPMMAEMAGRQVALDVRGHGRSAAPAAGMAWEGTAEDVLATVDAHDLHDLVGIGHSMGGASLVLAEQARPGTFRSLWLFEPIIFPPSLAGPDDAENPLVAGARRRRDTFPSAAAAYDNFAAKRPFDALDPAALAAYVRYGFETLPDGSVTLRCRPEVESQTYAMGPRHHAFDHLAEVACPVTVVRGRADEPGAATLAPLIAEGVPHGRLEDHPELGHFGPLEAPSAMAASVRLAVTGAP